MRRAKRAPLLAKNARNEAPGDVANRVGKELPLEPQPPPACKGSFDCATLRIREAVAPLRMTAL
jgi:hypothetical protein